MTRPNPTFPRRLAAAFLASCLVAAAPGAEGYRLLAQEIVRPNVPVSPAQGPGVAAGVPGVSLPGPALGPSPLSSPLGLPRTAVPVVSPAPQVDAVQAGALAAGAAPAPDRALAPQSSAQARPSAQAAAAPGRGGGLATARKATAGSGGGLLNRLLWREVGPAAERKPTALGRALDRLGLPALKAGGSGETIHRAAEDDFSRRRGAEAAPAQPDGEIPVGPGPMETRPSASLLPARGEGTSAGAKGALPSPQPSPRRGEGAIQYRSALFPVAFAAVAAAAWLAALAVPAVLGWASAAVGLQAAAEAMPVVGTLHAVWSAITNVGFYAAAGAAAFAAWDVLSLGVSLWTGRGISEERFYEAVGEDLREMGLGTATIAALVGHAPGRGLIHPYDGKTWRSWLSFGFTTPHGVYLRPEIARYQWLRRRVLRHELYHYFRLRERGPPGAPARPEPGLLRSLGQEINARVKEGTSSWVKELKVPLLERVLREAQISLELPYQYDVMVLKPAAGAVEDPAVFSALSGGRAKVREVQDPAVLPGDAGPQRVIVAPGSFGWLPRGGSEEAKKKAAELEKALKQLDDQYLLSKGLLPRGASPTKGTLRELEQLSRDKRRSGEADEAHSARLLSTLWRQVAASQLKDLEAMKWVGDLYGRLQDRGVLLLPFRQDEPGVDVLLRLLRYWEGPDGGRFQLTRVDLPEGGHVLVARKLEARVNLWLKPQNGKTIAASVTNVSRDPAKAGKADEVLRAAGFEGEQLALFKKIGVQVRHAFGADIGENRLFISVPKRKARAIKRYAELAGASIEASQGGYRVHLLDSGGLQNLPKTWKLGVTGAGGRIFDIDTGIDVTHPDFAGVLNAMAEDGAPQPRVTSYDVTGEGDADYIGHGTHKGAISYASGVFYRGMAPDAEGRMGKVFTKDGFGANDGDIMAAAAEAMRWGADVISLSLGSPGDVGDSLAVFFSNLAEQKNSRGHKPIVTASMGNSGPFNRTGSQPAAGENVIAVAAAAKSLDDNDPEISFYSSIGFARDTRFHLQRWVLKPSHTALGGDVRTAPGSKDVYDRGIEAAKSKDMEPSPSDTPDRLRTRMSGTSMSNPMTAGIALLVKQLALRFAKPATAAYDFFLENLPYAVRVILERSAVDMRVPIPFQGAGFVDAYEAARLAVRTVGGPAVEVRGGLMGLVGRPIAMARAVWKALGGGAKAEAASEESPWDWIARAKAVQAIDKAVYEAAEKAWAKAAQEAEAKGRQGSHPEAPAEEPPSQQAVGDLAYAAAQKTFNAAREVAAPALVEALKDPVWLVRYYAALGLMNLKSPSAALELAQVAVSDPDGRVRQAAFLALGANSSFAADALLANAVSDARPDVAAYAAYVLARHGNAAGVERLIQEASSADKKMRFTAAWLLGEIGGKAGKAGADALGRRVRDLQERGNIRHLGAAALAEIAGSDDDQVTDEAVVALLDSAGEQDLALTRTISKFFSAASRRRNFAERMRGEPLKSRVVQFILANKGWVGRPGALGELVSLLARLVNVPLDIPSPAPDADGTGVPGVDPNLGPVHLLVEVPASAKITKYLDMRGLASPQASGALQSFGLDPLTLSKHEAAVQVAMPVSQNLWVNVPDSKVAAFTAELESKGYRVRRARPKYRLLHDTGPQSGAPELREKLGLTGKGVLVVYLDEGGDLSHPAISRERVTATRNFSEEGGPEDVTQEGIGHGTHGMGIVGGRSFEGSPYAGMAPDVEFAVGKVLGANGGSDAMVMAGMEWAASLADASKRPVVVNMSLGGPGEADSPLSKLVNRLQLQDVAVIAAAGNEGPQEGTIGSPANAALAFKIGALDKAGKLTFYSSRDRAGATNRFFWMHRGGKVDFELPNPYEIVSTLATTLAEKLKDAATTVLFGGKPLFQTMSGTSMAAPHATGQLAQLVQRFAEAMQKDGGTLPRGYWLWLGELVNRTAQPLEGHKPHEVGSGVFDARAAAKALEEALKDSKRVRREAEELHREAQERYGSGPVSRSAFWLRPIRAAGRVLRRWIVPSLTLNAFRSERLAEPARDLAEAASARVRAAARAAVPWWKHGSAKRTAVTLPLYALRRGEKDPGIGKLTDLGRYFRQALAPIGVGVVALMPHFAVLGESPYAPVSLYAVNEDHLDWSKVNEVEADPALGRRLEAGARQHVDYAALREREAGVARAAYASFVREHLERGTARAAGFGEFSRKHAAWLGEYAEYMALAERLGKPSSDWTAAEVSRARGEPGFSEAVERRKYAQWNAYGQLEAALEDVHAQGGRVLFDVPMFRAKASVDAWKRPELFTDLATRNPGVVNQWVKEDWKDLALWNWTRAGQEGFRAQLEPFRHWLGLGFDGARADALHFAYDFGNGQLSSGDEPGDAFVAALAGVFAERGAFPLAEAFEGKDAAARRFGFVTVYGDFRPVSTHDDPRREDFMRRLQEHKRAAPAGENSVFVGYTLGDEWADPFPVKELSGGKSLWRYRIPLPGDSDYKARVRRDSRPQLAALKALERGGVWSEPTAVAKVLEQAADTFVKVENGEVRVWAAAMDWFMEEWGRDTFIALPGLLLATGRFEEAKANLRGFARHEKDGLLPNRIGKEAEYNSADAPLWFIQAVGQTVEKTNDRAFADEMLPVLRRIVRAYETGTGYDRYGRFNRIAMGADGLVATPAQSTWMDADPEGLDKPVTPRHGKAVEINALWYSALKTLARFEREAGEAARAQRLEALAARTKRSFNEKFWFKAPENRAAWGGSGGALRDVVEGDPHAEAIRPNMLLAVSHGGDLLSPERQEAVVLAATKDLLTPYGLRTLSPRDSHYRSSYDTAKPPIEKDQAYHQGTAWPWLMGPYLDALAKVRRSQGWDETRVRAEALGLLRPLAEFLVTRPEGSLPEVFDGGHPIEALRRVSLDDPRGLARVFDGSLPPQNPGGTRSQAWSVAEMLRVLSR